MTVRNKDCTVNSYYVSKEDQSTQSPIVDSESEEEEKHQESYSSQRERDEESKIRITTPATL